MVVLRSVTDLLPASPGASGGVLHPSGMLWVCTNIAGIEGRVSCWASTGPNRADCKAAICYKIHIILYYFMC